MRAGCGARQWRPRAARGVLHGEHGDAGHSRHRLRHPLRFRPVPPDHRAGLAAGISGRVARASATPGNSSGRRWSTTSISAAVSSTSTTAAATARTWRPAETVQAVAYDTPIVGWRGQHVNALRLWSARSPDPLRLDVFNTGDYLGASRRGGARRIDLQIPLSERRERRGPRAAAAPGIFLRFRLAAGSDQAASRRRRAAAQPRAPRSRCSSTTPIRALPSPS